MATPDRAVLVLSYFYPPDNTSGVFRSLYFFNHIARRKKWNIYVLTLDPQAYRADQSQDMKLLDQVDSRIRIYTAKAIFLRDAVISLKNKVLWRTNSDVVSLASPNRSINKTLPSRPSSWARLKDILTEEILSFPDDKIGWLPFAFREACRIIRKKGIRIIYSSASPWTSHLLGHLLKKKYGIPLVLDYRDPWFGNPYHEAHLSSLFSKASFMLEKAIIRSADKVICNTNRLRKLYQQTFGHSEKFITITNGYEPVGEVTDACMHTDSSSSFVMVHAGALYGARNPDNFFRALDRLARRTDLPSIRVILVGAGEEIKQKIENEFGDTALSEIVTVTPRVDHARCLEYLQAADLLLLFQQGTALQVPRKLYEYIGLGKPILGICNEGETEDIIRANSVGVSVRDKDDDIFDAMIKIITKPALYKGWMSSSKFQNDVLSRQVENIFTNLISIEQK